MRYLSAEEASELSSNYRRQESGVRNGFSEEFWNRVFDGRSKMLTEEDFAGYSKQTMLSYAGKERARRIDENRLCCWYMICRRDEGVFVHPVDSEEAER